MRFFLIEARTREVLDMSGAGPTGDGYAEATINEAGDRVVWATSPVNPDRWLLIEGRREPVQGNVAILGPEGSEPTVDLQWIKDNVDFGELRDLGGQKMFWGELHRRPID